MASPVCCIGLLACMLALSSAQSIIFNNDRRTSSSGSSSTCQVGGRSGTCKSVRDCPENVTHLRNRNRTALLAAKSTCQKVFQNGQQIQLLCCPAVLPPVPPSVAFRNHPQCGTSVFAPGRIVGGEPVRKLEDFPWMVVLKWRPDGVKPLYRCGGAVINERWVLTASHCITDNGPTSVRVRDLDLRTQTDDSFSEPPEDIPVERLFRHPNYTRVFRTPNRGLFNDIALIKLSKDVVFSDISKPLCLPERKRPTAQYELLKRSYIAGWGLTEFGGETSSSMMWAGVDITSQHSCQMSYARAGVRVDDPDQLCAYGNDLKQDGCVPGAEDGSCNGGVDACEGDSGGPLMEKRDEANRQRWYAIGVISFGTGCGNPNFPGLYARVDQFMDWISETVANN